MTAPVDSKSNAIFQNFSSTSKTIVKALAIIACIVVTITTLHFLNKKYSWIDTSAIKKETLFLIYTGVALISFLTLSVANLCLQSTCRPLDEVDLLFNNKDSDGKIIEDHCEVDGKKVYRLFFERSDFYQPVFTLSEPGKLDPSAFFTFGSRSQLYPFLIGNQFYLSKVKDEPGFFVVNNGNCVECTLDYQSLQKALIKINISPEQAIQFIPHVSIKGKTMGASIN